MVLTNFLIKAFAWLSLRQSFTLSGALFHALMLSQMKVLLETSDFSKIGIKPAVLDLDALLSERKVGFWILNGWSTSFSAFHIYKCNLVEYNGTLYLPFRSLLFQSMQSVIYNNFLYNTWWIRPQDHSVLQLWEKHLFQCVPLRATEK